MYIPAGEIHVEENARLDGAAGRRPDPQLPRLARRVRRWRAGRRRRRPGALLSDADGRLARPHAARPPDRARPGPVAGARVPERRLVRRDVHEPQDRDGSTVRPEADVAGASTGSPGRPATTTCARRGSRRAVDLAGRPAGAARRTSVRPPTATAWRSSCPTCPTSSSPGSGRVTTRSIDARPWTASCARSPRLHSSPWPDVVARPPTERRRAAVVSRSRSVCTLLSPGVGGRLRGRRQPGRRSVPRRLGCVRHAARRARPETSSTRLDAISTPLAGGARTRCRRAACTAT